MLLKALKYDFRSILKIWTIITVAILLVSILCGSALRYIIDDSLNDSAAFLSPLAVIVLVLSVFALMAYMIAPSILLYVRYYKNFYTDEGYLTFTLPVGRETLFLSKILNALIFNSLTAITAFLSITIALAIAPKSSYAEGSMLSSVISSINDTIKRSGNGYGYFFLKLLLGIVIALLVSILITLVIYGCISIASTIAKKMKLLACVLLIYGINTAVTIVGYILIALGNWFTEGLKTIDAYGSVPLEKLAEMSVMLVMIFSLCAIIPLVYKFVLGRIKNRLNLA